MKRIIFLLTIILLFTTNVYAKSDVYSINMDIYINQNGSLDITETWDVKADSGTEWFKQIKNLRDIDITNYRVSMDGTPFTEKTWDVNGTLEEKKGFYGINKIDNGLELCFGKNDYNRHTFTLKYVMNNVIFNTNDAQVLIGQIINPMEGHNFENFKVVISSFYSFPHDLDMWGTGYQGLAYVDGGKIYLSNEENPLMGEKSYASVLVKFPLNTFNTTKKDPSYETFADVKKAFDEGTYQFKKSIWSTIIPIASFLGIIGLITYFAKKNGYGYINNKKIKEKETPAFRDIPCKKDLFYANFLMKINGFGYSPTSIIGAIILKWVKENKVEFIKETKNGLFKEKEDYKLDLTKSNKFTESEKKLYDIMYEASDDGILEANELKKWARIHSDRFSKLFKELEDDEESKLKSANHIYKRKSKEECFCKNVLDDKIYEDSKQLLGLKIFLKEFSSIDKRETIEVHLWDEYLMFAYLFGIADKVLEQLKKLYPEIIEQDMDNYHTMMMANTFANSAVSAANAYSAGGGGYSTGGGGGGGFGGGSSGGR